MYCYSAYDHRIASEIELPALAPASGWQAEDAEIVVTEVDRATMVAREQQEAQRPGGRCVVSSYLGQVYYAVRGGRQIELYRDGDVEDDFVARCAISLPLAIALRQRGMTPFHGAAVARDGRAVAFMGPSGAGKSTLTEAFFQNGYDVLCDDLLVLRFDGDAPDALPGPKLIRLREGSGRVLVDDYESLPKAWSDSPQRFRDIDRTPRSPARLERIYLINGTSASHTHTDPIDGRSAVMTLAAQTWAYNRFSDLEFTAPHMARLASLAHHGRVVGLQRVRTLEALDDTVRVVEADLGLAPLTSGDHD